MQWLEQECAKITEANALRKSKQFFQQIKKLKKTSFQPQSQSINSKTGSILTELNDVLARWNEYGKQLFETNIRQQQDEIEIASEDLEPEPLLDEIETAIRQLKPGKSPGLDGIPAELIQNSGHAAVVALHYLCCKIWKTCKWPEEWKKQEFVM